MTILFFLLVHMVRRKTSLLIPLKIFQSLPPRGELYWPHHCEVEYHSLDDLFDDFSEWGLLMHLRTLPPSPFNAMFSYSLANFFPSWWSWSFLHWDCFQSHFWHFWGVNFIGLQVQVHLLCPTHLPNYFWPSNQSYSWLTTAWWYLCRCDRRRWKLQFLFPLPP